MLKELGDIPACCLSGTVGPNASGCEAARTGSKIVEIVATVTVLGKLAIV
jgi:hypothetical protein